MALCWKVDDWDRIELSGGPGTGSQGAREMRGGRLTAGQDGEGLSPWVLPCRRSRGSGDVVVDAPSPYRSRQETLSPSLYILQILI